MKNLKHILLLAALSFAAVQSQGMPRASVKVPEKKIQKENIVYRGTPVAEGGDTWKSVVQIIFNDSSLCTGAIIQSNVLLTAAHCVKNMTVTGLEIRLFRGSEIVDVKRISSSDFHVSANPSYYSSQNPAHDLAVIVLKNELYSWDSEMKALGFVYQDISNSINLRSKVYVPGAGSTSSKEKYTNEKLFYGTGIITGYPYGGGAFRIRMNSPYGICVGDSGSPVLVKVNGEFYIAGVNSAIVPSLGAKCGTEVYAAFVSAGDYDWIQSAITTGTAVLSVQ